MKTDPPVLRRLGPVPFWRGSEKCLDSLRAMYARAMEAAARRQVSSPKDGARDRRR